MKPQQVSFAKINADLFRRPKQGHPMPNRDRVAQPHLANMRSRDLGQPLNLNWTAQGVDKVGDVLHGHDDTKGIASSQARKFDLYRPLVYCCNMNTRRSHLRLQKAREAAGFATATDAARAHGWTPVTYRAHEAGTRNLKHDVAAQYAKAFGVSLAWLLTGDDIDTNIGTIVPHLGVVGTVEAGVWREADSAIEEREVVAPKDQRFSRSRQYLLEVRGDSMNLTKPSPLTPGCLIRCVDVRDGEVTLKTGQIVVVERRRDNNYLVETTVKRLTVYPDRYELHPESSNPIHQPYFIKNDGRGQDRTVIEVIAVVTGVISDLPV